MKKFFFKPKYENAIYEKLKSFLWSYFNKLQALSEPRSKAGRLRKEEMIIDTGITNSNYRLLETPKSAVSNIKASPSKEKKKLEETISKSR